MSLLGIYKFRRSRQLSSLQQPSVKSCDVYLLRLEQPIAAAELDKLLVSDGLRILQNIIRERHTFFAVYNVDFAEDTPDEKRMLTCYRRGNLPKKSAWNVDATTYWPSSESIDERLDAKQQTVALSQATSQAMKSNLVLIQRG